MNDFLRSTSGVAYFGRRRGVDRFGRETRATEPSASADIACVTCSDAHLNT